MQLDTDGYSTRMIFTLLVLHTCPAPVYDGSPINTAGTMYIAGH